MRRVLTLFVSLAALGVAQDRGARAIGTNTTITSPGSYILVNHGDLAVEPGGVGVTIAASGVTLDLNSRQILGPGGNQGIGIHINGARGVRVHNGRIANTAFGVVVTNSANVTITDLEIRGQGLMVSAPPPETGIMIVQSKSVVVENNNIYNVGLGVFVRGGQSSGNRIANNTIAAGTNGVLGICYNPAPGDANGPRGDLITGNLISGFSIGVQVVPTSLANVFRANTIAFKMTAFDPANSPQDIENIKVALP